MDHRLWHGRGRDAQQPRAVGRLPRDPGARARARSPAVERDDYDGERVDVSPLRRAGVRSATRRTAGPA